jgi:four helix bundle protein
MADYHDLNVWAEAHELAVAAHNTAVKIRGSHYLSIRSQIIRAAISIPTNIVEGSEQKSNKDFIRFLGYSVASCSELEYHFEFSRDIHILPVPQFENHQKQIEKVRKMLHGLIKSLR